MFNALNRANFATPATTIFDDRGNLTANVGVITIHPHVRATDAARREAALVDVFVLEHAYHGIKECLLRKHRRSHVTRARALTAFGAAVLCSALSVGPESPVEAQQKPFELVDATIEDVQAEFKAGRLTSRALVQRLSRSHRGVRQERSEDQLGHHHQSEGAGRSRRARCGVQEVRARSARCTAFRWS